MATFVADMFQLSMYLFSRLDNFIVLYCAGLVFFLFSFNVVKRLMFR